VPGVIEPATSLEEAFKAVVSTTLISCKFDEYCIKLAAVNQSFALVSVGPPKRSLKSTSDTTCDISSTGPQRRFPATNAPIDVDIAAIVLVLSISDTNTAGDTLKAMLCSFCCVIEKMFSYVMYTYTTA
jgi:hypothetical protein